MYTKQIINIIKQKEEIKGEETIYKWIYNSKMYRITT